MADEAFALSPISARATQPGAEDYEAISQAFMETSRGRWFLGEYAKRNRNADTRMVLDAVAKIEESLASQRQQAAADNGLAEALAAIRSSVDEARTAAAAAVESLALEENLAPIRKGARIIKEISWRWREIGADARICDLIDSQVSAIDGACGQVSSTSAQAALEAAFDLIKARIAEFGDSDMAAPQTAEAAAAPAHQSFEEAAPSPSMPAPEEAFSSPVPAAVAVMMPAEAVATLPETPAPEHAEAAVSTPAMPAEAVAATEVYAAMVETVAVVAEAADTTAETADIAVEALDAPSEADAETAEAADAYDQALLDMVALEMGAPDAADFDEAPVVADDEAQIPEQPPAEPLMVAEHPEPMSMAEPPPVQPIPQPAFDAPPEPAVEPSLGSTLLANGIVRKPKFAASDPLAPIRRMSQAEKIAFFS